MILTQKQTYVLLSKRISSTFADTQNSNCNFEHYFNFWKISLVACLQKDKGLPGTAAEVLRKKQTVFYHLYSINPRGVITVRAEYEFYP